ncbi:MAG: DUF1801 domain-containing protein [Gemmatimonadales bacterium]|nr:MAG: DUF1801 domain-containing protein [Gemmatimonadales bacterium]
MAELKTKPTKLSVTRFIDGIKDERKRRDCRTVMKIMKRVTKATPKMWGTSIVGYGTYHYKYASGREGDWFTAGFSPRAQSLTLYIMSGFKGHDALMKKLGKHKTGRSCLYIKRLDEIDLDVLKELIERSVRHVEQSGA